MITTRTNISVVGQRKAQDRVHRIPNIKFVSLKAYRFWVSEITGPNACGHYHMKNKMEAKYFQWKLNKNKNLR